MPPKSILKKSVQSVSAQGSVKAQGRDPKHDLDSRHYQTALHHANLIQARKDTEAAVLVALEELVSFPTDTGANASLPSRSDLARFQQLIQPFTPSDYDELFTERNCVDKCAYVFCQRGPTKEADRGPVRLVRGSGNDKGFTPVLAKHAEMWCGRECARRAMFIKVQLNDTPAWERTEGSLKQIQVLDEASEDALIQNVDAIKLSTTPENGLAKAMDELAMERGEDTANISRMTSVMSAEVKENTGVNTVQPQESLIKNKPYSVEG